MNLIVFVAAIFFAVGLPVQAVEPNCVDAFKEIIPAKLPEGLEAFPEQPAFLKELSEKTMARLKGANFAAVEAEIKALAYKTATQETHFQNGSIYLDAGNLIWKKKDGSLLRLVAKESHGDRSITNILISPDGKKIAYSTTLSRSDQHVWYIQSIADQSKNLMEEPILVRMDGFSWGADSNTVYYSHFANIEDVKAGTKPIVKVRSFNLSTKTSREVFDHGQPANYSIYDVDGGKTLIAHRILGPGAGIKALFSMYKGVRRKDGGYDWVPLIFPNSTVGHFLGTVKKRGITYAVMHNNQLGDTYGINMVQISTSKTSAAKATSLVAADSKLVLHNSQMHKGRLFLEYYDPVSLESSMKIVDAATGKVEKEIRFSDFGLLNHGSLSLPVSFNGPEVTFNYVDVLNNVRVFSYNLEKKSLKALQNPEANPFNAANVRVVPVSFKSEDGTVISGLKFYTVDEAGAPVKPKFFVLKDYGMIGVKYVAEPTEAQMTMRRQGVYFTPDTRGGAGPNAQHQVDGSQNFDLRYMDKRAAAFYITQQDPMFAKYGFDPKEVLVAIGRSYNGGTMLTMAAGSPQMARAFVSVVPLWDSSYQIKNGRFGVIAPSDYFPKRDPQSGGMILDEEFYKGVEKHNPVNALDKIPEDKKLMVLTGGRDDRVDLLQREPGYVQQLYKRLKDNLSYIQDPNAAHAARWYFPALFTKVDELFP